LLKSRNFSVYCKNQFLDNKIQFKKLPCPVDEVPQVAIVRPHVQDGIPKKVNKLKKSTVIQHLKITSFHKKYGSYLDTIGL
jgi:hypothetical protein